MTRSRATFALLLPALALAALLGWAVLRGVQVALPEVPGARLPCLSYAPFHLPGQSPFDPALRISPAQIEADLRQLASVTGCVRTYGLDHGLDQVPAIARQLGLRVWLGAWIGRDPAANAAQLRRALQLANEYADTLDLLIVGNEVLLRRELPAAELARLLAQARAASPVPVAYADVWEFWLRHAAVLQPQVDVIAAHVLPYWEDRPVASRDAARHVHEIAAQLRAAFGKTPVYIAETGWPAEGRQRGPAVPGRVEQARLARELLAREAATPLHFNWIESYDQPWKRALEGAMGGYWGVFEAGGAPRLAFTGPVQADPQWVQLPAGAAVGAVLALLAGALRGRRGAWALAVLGLGGGLVGLLAVLEWRLIELWSRNAVEAAIGGTVAVVGSATALLATWRLAGGADAGGRRGAVAAWRERAPERWLATLQLALLFAAATNALGLLFDGRYRPLDWPLYLAPAVLLVALAMAGERLRPGAREERVLAAVVTVCAPLIVLNEGVVNGEAWVTAGVLGLLAVGALVPVRSADRSGSGEYPRR